MDNKIKTLETVYNLVKSNPHPTDCVLYPNEIILRLNFSWEEVVKYLEELKQEDLVSILNHSPALIKITEKGISFLHSDKSRTPGFMYAA